MLYIFSNSDDKSIHHIVCTESDIRAGIIISRLYEREQISGEPIRVQFCNDTAAPTNIFAHKRYEALKRTDKSNDTFEEEIRAKVAELGKGEPVNSINIFDDVIAKVDELGKSLNAILADLPEGENKPDVDIKYNQFINDIISKYRDDKRIIELKDFVYNCIDLKGYDAEKVYHDVDAEICKLLTTGFKEETKAKVAQLSKPDVAPVVPYDDADAFLYSANVNELVSKCYKDKGIITMLDAIKEVARNNNYDVDKFVKDVVSAHKDAHRAYKHTLKTK